MKISTEYGVVEFGVKNDLNEEEGAAYLPGYYQNCVVELSFIKSNGNMGGHQLMKAFLNHEIVQSAKLVFLDCSPLYMGGGETKVMQTLHDFYAQYGFIGKSSNGYSRMWRVQAIPESIDNIFELGFEQDNDLHSVLLDSFQSRKTLRMAT